MTLEPMIVALPMGIMSSTFSTISCLGFFFTFGILYKHVLSLQHMFQLLWFVYVALSLVIYVCITLITHPLVSPLMMLLCMLNVKVAWNEMFCAMALLSLHPPLE